mgnify:CR=1 FL=1
METAWLWCNRPHQLLRCDSEQCGDQEGTVLTQMSKFWFNMTKDILPNHMISTDVKRYAEFSGMKNMTETSNEMQKTEHASHWMHRKRLYYRQRLGKLSKRRHRMRHPSAGSWKSTAARNINSLLMGWEKPMTGLENPALSIVPWKSQLH